MALRLALVLFVGLVAPFASHAQALNVKDGNTSLLKVRSSGIVDAPLQSEVHAAAPSQGPIAFDTPTQIAFTNVAVDTQAEFSTATSWFTASTAGSYLVTYTQRWEQGTITPGQDYHAFICIDAPNNSRAFSTIFPQKTGGNAEHPTVTGAQVLALNAGQKVGLCVLHGSATGSPIMRGAEMQIVKLK